ncbi:MAG: IPTL-CTERM sorting domain-containing protein [Nitrospirae bacterium]|nr:IPTL-CTERM sorting domain-containing protein [Nitrospirota bacterium]
MNCNFHKRVILTAILSLSFFLISLEPAIGALYGVNSGTGGNFLAIIDETTAGVTNIGATGLTIDGLDFSPGNVLFAADNSNNRLVTLDPATGAVDTVIGPFGIGTVEGLAFHPTSGALFGIDVVGDNLLAINTTTGAATVIGSFGVQGAFAGLSFSRNGNTLYGVNFDDGGLYTINTTTGAATLIGTGAIGPLGLATDPETGDLYVAEWRGGADMTLAIVSPVNGSRTNVGTMVGAQQIEGLAFENVSTIPTMNEWGMIIFMALAGVGSVYYLRRKKITG